MSGQPGSPRSLWGAFSGFTLREVLRYDFLIGLLGGGSGVWLAIGARDKLASVVPLAAGLVGIVIGAVVAGVAVLAAFLDQAFLRKLRLIKREPVRYISPFLFTAALGVIGSLLLLVLSGLPARTPTWVVATTSGLAGLAIVWTLASVIPNLAILVQFVGLRFEASDMADVQPLPPRDQERAAKV